MNLLQTIEESTLQYGNESRRAIGEFILKERDHLYRYSLQDIADYTYTSKSAVVRYAQSIGYSGWKEFLKAFVEEQRYMAAHYSDIDPNMPFDKESTNYDIIQKLSSLQVESILDTADLLNTIVLEKALVELKKANRIALFGMSPNSLLGELFARKMLSIGRPIEIPILGDTKLLAASLSKGDCAIIISYSGNNPSYDPITIMSILKRKEIPIIALTSVGDSFLRENANYTFSISSREKLYSKIATFATEVSIGHILNIIYACYFMNDYDVNYERKTVLGKELESNRFSNALELEDGFEE